MAYIALTKNREGNHYVYLRQSFRVGNKTSTRNIKRIGILEHMQKKDPDILNKLKLQAKNGALGGVDPELITCTLSTKSKASQSIFNFGHLLLEEFYDQLNIKDLLNNFSKTRKIKYDLNGILQLLTYQRIINPESKLKNYKRQTKMVGGWNHNIYDIYRSLDLFKELKEQIQLTIHDSISKITNRTCSLVLYDVTNYYFETDYDDEDLVDENGELIEKALRKRGASKEKRPNPIVQLGLFVDNNNIPISYKLFPGNQNDPITYIPAIEQVKKQFGIERLVTVADKAMNSKNNISETIDAGDGYIFSQKVRGTRGVSKEIQEFALSKNGWIFNITGSYGYKSMIRTRVLNSGEKVDEKVIVTWSEKYARREQVRRDGATEYADKLRDAEKFRQAFKRGGKKYLELQFIDDETGEVKEFTPKIYLNHRQISEDAKYDGLNIICTSEVEADELEIIDSYHQLYRIEESFRVTKTDLKSRPVYVRINNHIEGHFLTCFVSLVMIRMLQLKLENKYSVKILQEGLKNMNYINLSNGYGKISVDEIGEEVLKRLNYDYLREVMKEEILYKHFKQKK